jgi:hypothetical protein
MAGYRPHYHYQTGWLTGKFRKTRSVDQHADISLQCSERLPSLIANVVLQACATLFLQMEIKPAGWPG